MPKENLALLKTPLAWIEATDVEKVSYQKATWIPLLMQMETLIRGKNGTVGYRREYHDVETVIVPLSSRERFRNAGWEDIIRNGADAAWVDEGIFHAPGHHYDDLQVSYPVLRQWFETGEPNQWHLLQELEIGLKLFKSGDIWIRPDENDVDVARLERDHDGKPHSLLIRAEHLRDYLCARGAALLLTTFVVRDADEDNFPDLGDWDSETKTRIFPTGLWEGRHWAIHEGGMPYGQQTHVLHVWRESVNPEDDVPEMPHPTAETHGMSESFIKSEDGNKLFALRGRI